MSIWVRSQDKEFLMKVDNINLGIDVYTKKPNKLFTFVDGVTTSFTLGTYKSKERAIEVLDEIQNLLIPKVILNTYSVENKETAYSKELVIEPIINDIKVQNNVNMFYQIPEE